MSSSADGSAQYWINGLQITQQVERWMREWSIPRDVREWHPAHHLLWQDYVERG